VALSHCRAGLCEVGMQFDPHRPKINDQQSLRLAKGDGFKDPFISGTIFPVDSIPDLYLIGSVQETTGNGSLAFSHR